MFPHRVLNFFIYLALSFLDDYLKKNVLIEQAGNFSQSCSTMTSIVIVFLNCIEIVLSEQVNYFI